MGSGNYRGECEGSSYMESQHDLDILGRVGAPMAMDRKDEVEALPNAPIEKSASY